MAKRELRFFSGFGCYPSVLKSCTQQIELSQAESIQDPYLFVAVQRRKRCEKSLNSKLTCTESTIL